MRSTTIADEEDSYTDRIGWNTSVGTVLEDNEEIVEEPKTITHQCSMCGSMMTVPKPRERGTESSAHTPNVVTQTL